MNFINKFKILEKGFYFINIKGHVRINKVFFKIFNFIFRIMNLICKTLFTQIFNNFFFLFNNIYFIYMSKILNQILINNY